MTLVIRLQHHQLRRSRRPPRSRRRSPATSRTPTRPAIPARSRIRSRTSFGGSDVVSITRQANAALLDSSTPRPRNRPARARSPRGWRPGSDGERQRHRRPRQRALTQNGDSPSAMLGQFAERADDLRGRPEQHGRGAGASSPPRRTSQPRSTPAPARCNQVREQADANMATSVTHDQFAAQPVPEVNATIVTGLASGADISPARGSARLAS